MKDDSSRSLICLLLPMVVDKSEHRIMFCHSDVSYKSSGSSVTVKRKVSIKIDTKELLKGNSMGKDIYLQFCKAIDTALQRNIHRSFSPWNRSCIIGGTLLDILVLNDLINVLPKMVLPIRYNCA